MKKLSLLCSILAITACTNVASPPSKPIYVNGERASVQRACSTLKKQYPLNPDSQIESSLEDFTAYFASKGTFDNYLRSKSELSDLELSNLNNQSKIINQIRHDLFDKSQTSLHTDLTLKTLKVSSQISNARLQLGAQRGPAATGPRLSHQLTWPASGPVTIDAHLLDGTNISTAFTGDWSLFKLLDSMAIDKGSNGSVTLDLELAPDGIGIEYVATLPETLIHWRELTGQLVCSEL